MLRVTTKILACGIERMAEPFTNRENTEKGKGCVGVCVCTVGGRETEIERCMMA